MNSPEASQNEPNNYSCRQNRKFSIGLTTLYYQFPVIFQVRVQQECGSVTAWLCAATQRKVRSYTFSRHEMSLMELQQGLHNTDVLHDIYETEKRCGNTGPMGSNAKHWSWRHHCRIYSRQRTCCLQGLRLLPCKHGPDNSTDFWSPSPLLLQGSLSTKLYHLPFSWQPNTPRHDAPTFFTALSEVYKGDWDEFTIDTETPSVVRTVISHSWAPRT